MGMEYWNGREGISSQPMGRTLRRTINGCNGYMTHQMVIPTIYTDIRGRMIQSNQYSGTEHFWSSESGYFFQSLPGIFFFYDISPVKRREKKICLII
ncbi:uncharacterized protein LOC132179641 isoform X4 [Corylus avellana]|uniref:uncharacterized protein LOC132179641 isoform X4 n=1 Tax=Corylus avellana TaxID=13451 RepID=UPI00286BA2CD|nr:uncharacterized protein LOC132179641 isoform X4 [Corylus avellana]